MGDREGSIILSALTTSTSILNSEYEYGDKYLLGPRNEFVTSGSSESESTESLESTHSADKVYQSSEGGFRVPKYFQVLFTLFVCFLILFVTLAIIHQVKKLCQRSSCAGKKSVPLIRINSDKPENNCVPGSGTQTCHNKFANVPRDSSDKNGCGCDTSSLPGDKTASMRTSQELHLKPKKTRFVRRVSGPFGDEALEFVGQNYNKKVTEKKQHEKLGDVQGLIKSHQSMKKAKTPSPSVHRKEKPTQ